MHYDLSLHLVTDESQPFDQLCRLARQAADVGITVIQLRKKHAGGRELIGYALRLSEALAGSAALLINDRLDVALAARDAGADIAGVHLGQSDVPPTVARRYLGADALIGWTAHSAAHLDAVARLPEGTVDYLGVGVVHATETKPDHPPVLGIRGFADFAQRSPLPCVAIGGIGIPDAAPLRAAGAAGLAVVSAICSAPRPAEAAREFAHAFRTHTGGTVEEVRS